MGTFSGEGGVVNLVCVRAFSNEGNVVSSSCVRKEQESTIAIGEVGGIIEQNIAGGNLEHCCLLWGSGRTLFHPRMLLQAN